MTASVPEWRESLARDKIEEYSAAGRLQTALGLLAALWQAAGRGESVSPDSRAAVEAGWSDDGLTALIASGFVAVTADGRIVMVEQYRFGVGELTIEPVAGMVDKHEDSLDAAKRELLEETGFGEGAWRYLGSVQANPAIHNNLCHHWLVEDVVFIQDPTPDSGEAIRVHLLELVQVY